MESINESKNHQKSNSQISDRENDNPTKPPNYFRKLIKQTT